MGDIKVEFTKKLSLTEFYVTQEKGTERPFTGEYVKHFEKGIYFCKVCGKELFRYSFSDGFIY